MEPRPESPWGSPTPVGSVPPTRQENPCSICGAAGNRQAPSTCNSCAGRGGGGGRGVGRGAFLGACHKLNLEGKREGSKTWATRLVPPSCQPSAPGGQACGWHHTKQALRTHDCGGGEVFPRRPKGIFTRKKTPQTLDPPRITRLLHTPGEPFPPPHLPCPGPLLTPGRKLGTLGLGREGKESKGKLNPGLRMRKPDRPQHSSQRAASSSSAWGVRGASWRPQRTQLRGGGGGCQAKPQVGGALS